jgi:hypothetical protein
MAGSGSIFWAYEPRLSILSAERNAVKRVSLFMLMMVFFISAGLMSVSSAPLGRSAMQPPTGTTSDLELVAHIGGLVDAVTVQGNHAYVAIGSELAVLDISNSSNPVRVGYVPLSYRVENLTVAGDSLYAATSFDGLRVIDVSDPAAPAEAGFYDTSGRALGVATAENYAYVAAGDGGLRIVDVSEPAVPTEIGFYETPWDAFGVAVAGSSAYVVDSSGRGEGGLSVIDISDPASLTEMGALDVDGGVLVDVAVAGNYAYVVDEWNGLRVVDVSNPVSLAEVGFYETAESARRVVVAEGYAYVTYSYGDLWVGPDASYRDRGLRGARTG